MSDWFRNHRAIAVIVAILILPVGLLLLWGICSIMGLLWVHLTGCWLCEDFYSSPYPIDLPVGIIGCVVLFSFLVIVMVGILIAYLYCLLIGEER